MTEFFFPNNKCGVGGLVEKPIFKFVADCNIEPTPKPIFDCPLPVIAREPEIPCPEFNVKSKLGVGFGGGPDSKIENCDLKNRIKFEIAKKIDDTCPANANKCEFDVNLEVDIAIPVPPCPVLKVGNFNVKSGFSDQPCVEDKSRFEIRTRKIPGQNCDDPGSCEFEVDLSVIVPIPRTPCPEINVNSFLVRSDYVDQCGKGKNKFEIKTRHRPPSGCEDPGECKFDVDLEIFIPIPRPPCPEIKITAFSVSSGLDVPSCSRPQNRFEIRRKYEKAPCNDPARQDKCEFEIELEIFVPIPVPPCPEIRVESFEVKTGYVNTPCVNGQNKFTIKKRTTPSNCDTVGNCEFDVELSIVVPIPQPPCPTINIKKFEVKSDYASCSQGQNRFEITTTHIPPANCDEPGECNFDIELEINVPIPDPPCPEIKVKTFDVEVDYASCLTSKDSSLTITKTTKPPGCINASGPTGPTGPTCEFEIELHIKVPIPEPPCPKISGAVNVNYIAFNPLLPPPNLTNCNRFTVTKTTKPPPCAGVAGPTGVTGPTQVTGPTGPSECEFNLDIQLCVPVPQQVCPTFNVKSFKVEVKNKDCLNPQDHTNKFKIGSTNKPGKCDFDIELEIYIPIPKPPCPIFGTNLWFNTFLSGCGVPGGIFDVIPEVFPGNCQEPDTCAFLFDLALNIPIPRFVSDVFINVAPPTINVKWCQPGLKAASNAKLVFNRKINPWAGACDRGDFVWWEAGLDIGITIPPMPCNLVVLKPKANQFPVLRVRQGKEFVKLSITPKPAVGCNPCEFEFDLDIQLQCICRPNIITEDGSVIAGSCYDTTQSNTSNAGTGGRIWLDIARTSDCRGLGGQCTDEFQLIPNIELPPINIPCPEFYAANRVKINYLTDKTAAPYGDLRFEVVDKIDPCDPCVFDVYLDLYLQPPCFPEFTFRPDRSVTNPCIYTTAAEFYACQPGPDEELQIYIEETDTCKYDVYTYDKPPRYLPRVICDEFIDYGVNIYYATSRTAAPTGTISIEPRPVDDADDHCTYDVKLDITLPPPCYPKFTYNPSRTSVRPCFYRNMTELGVCAANPLIQVHIEETADCEYDVWVTANPIYYEPEIRCDRFIDYGVGIGYTTDRRAAPKGTISIVPRPLTDTDDYCTYDVKLDITLPPTCYPEFVFDSSGSTFTPEPYSCVSDYQTALSNLATDFLKITIEETGECDYNIVATAKIPIYEPKPLTFTKGTQNVTITPVSAGTAPSGTADITIVPDTSDCTKFTVNAAIAISIPGPICTGTVTLGNYGSGTLSCTNNQSEYLIDIQLATTSCPQQMQMLPMQSAANDTNNDPANAIMSLWDDNTFVDGFIAALGTNDRLRAAVKNLLRD